MTVSELKEQLGLTALCEDGEALSKEITGGYCGDLLSWVMSRAKSGDAWMTVMGNINSIGVAALADISCIILTESAPLDDDAKRRAEQNGVAVYQTAKNTYDTAVCLSKLLEKE